jgi:hypothetical protein
MNRALKKVIIWSILFGFISAFSLSFVTKPAETVSTPTLCTSIQSQQSIEVSHGFPFSFYKDVRNNCFGFKRLYSPFAWMANVAILSIVIFAMQTIIYSRIKKKK